MLIALLIEVLVTLQRGSPWEHIMWIYRCRDVFVLAESFAPLRQHRIHWDPLVTLRPVITNQGWPMLVALRFYAFELFSGFSAETCSVAARALFFFSDVKYNYQILFSTL